MHFQRHMLWSFCVQWVQLRREVIVRFVDIGGIVDHHRLTFFCFVDIGEIVNHHRLTFFCFVLLILVELLTITG